MDFTRMMNDTDRLQVMNRLFTSFEIYKFSNKIINFSLR